MQRWTSNLWHLQLCGDLSLVSLVVMVTMRCYMWSGAAATLQVSLCDSIDFWPFTQTASKGFISYLKFSIYWFVYVYEIPIHLLFAAATTLSPCRYCTLSSFKTCLNCTCHGSLYALTLSLQVSNEPSWSSQNPALSRRLLGGPPLLQPLPPWYTNSHSHSTVTLIQ